MAITRNDEMDRTLTTPGKNICCPSSDKEARQYGWQVWITCRGENAYDVDAVWSTPETYSSDPESHMCGCPFQGRNHAHAKATVSDLAAGWALYLAAKEQATARQPVRVLGEVGIV